MHRIPAGELVNITGLRKNPAKYFIDQPITIFSNNRPAEYPLSVSAFGALIGTFAEQEEKKSIKVHFCPSAARLEEITCHVEQYFSNVMDDDPNDFKE